MLQTHFELGAFGLFTINLGVQISNDTVNVYANISWISD